ncbi:hypothetical protein BGZ99_004639 [Dissophora globulifera]|uniref:Uncharacterized protein n=1 Tax=Dissophora globulifera TaxID=979702 RepID=A0A9P6RLL0_9FUNG|nr:hypothetical protein BGZ99_004639 [Dissophora globulifera]
MSMAGTDSNSSGSRHHPHQQQRYGPGSPGGSNNGSLGQSYVLYPDQPQPQSQSRVKQQSPRQQQQQQRSYGDLTPQSSFSSTSSHHNNNTNYGNTTSSSVSRGDSSGSNGMGASSVKHQQQQQPPKQSQLSYLRTPAVSTSSLSAAGAPPSPVSPSTPISPSPSPSRIEAVTSHLNLTHLDDPVQDRVNVQHQQQQQQSQHGYDQARYQQPRKKAQNTAQNHQQQYQEHDPYQQHQQHQQRHQQLQDDDMNFGSGSLKQSASSGSARSAASARSAGPTQGRGGHDQPLRQSPSSGSAYSAHSSHSPGGAGRHGQGELKQSGSSASAHSLPSVRSQQQQQLRPTHSSGSATSISSRRQQQQKQLQPNQAPSSSSSPPLLSHLSIDDDDHDRDQDNEKHQQQALQFQQQLQQKPPAPNGEDDDSDDSDSSSMLSYRRSISRVSMSFKRTNNGVPNISLFAPGQRPAMMSQGSSGYGGAGGALTSSQKMIQEQREERLRQQKLQQQQSQPHPEYGYGPSSGSTDQYSRQDEGRPMMRGNSNNNSQPHHQQYPGSSSGRGDQSLERNASADSYTAGSGSPSGRSPRQQFPGGSAGGSGGRSNPSSPSMANRQLNTTQHQHQHAPRSGHEGGHSQRQRPDHLTLAPNDYQQQQQGGGSMGAPRSRSPGNMGPPPRSPGMPMQGGGGGGLGGGSGGVYRQNGYPGGSSTNLPLPSSQRQGGATTPTTGSFSQNAGNGAGLNPHPVHHLAAGGYVRPEEAMGPANPTPEKAEDFVRQGIEYHETGDIAKATHFFRTAAELGDPVGMLMYGLSVRHGWGCAANRQLAFQYLQKSAEHAVGDLKSRDSFASTAAKGELVLAIYELGICFRHGWGADKNKKTAAYYFEIAANLGDPDAQNDLAWCYYHGVGVKKDMYKAAKYYRLAAAQGLNTVGNSWIWKDKYGGVPSSPTAEKGQTAF